MSMNSNGNDAPERIPLPTCRISRARLGIKRGGVEVEIRDPNALSILERIQAGEERISRANVTRRRLQLAHSVFGVAAVIAVIAGVVLAGLVITGNRRERERNRLAEMALQEEARIAEEKARAEAEAARAAKAEEARREQQAKAEAERKERLERETELAAARNEYDIAIRKFSGRKLSLWADLARDSRPGFSEDEFLCLVPRENAADADLYRLDSHTNGTFEASRIVRHELPTQVAASDLNALVAGRGALVLAKDAIYLFVPKGAEKGVKTSDRDIRPAEVLMAYLPKAISRFDLYADKVEFQLSFHGGDPRDPGGVLGCYGWRDSVSPRRIKDAISVDLRRQMARKHSVRDIEAEISSKVDEIFRRGTVIVKALPRSIR